MRISGGSKKRTLGWPSLNTQVLELAQRPSYVAVVQGLRCLKGVDTLTAITVTVETEDFRRFGHARAYMDFTGLVCSENSSGDRIRRGYITKVGNAHLRRVLVEAAWSYSHHNSTGATITKRRHGCPPAVVRITPAGRRTGCTAGTGV